MSFELPADVVSFQDLQILILEVERYSQWFSQAAVKQRVAKDSSSQPPVISPSAAEIIKLWGQKNEASQKSLDGLISSLKQLETKAPKFSVTLAAPPSGGLKKELAAWFRTNVSPNALVNFSFNRAILGGMVVSFGSHTYDWSFRRQILTGREKFAEVLRYV
jgi:hypothetical protein